MPRQPPNTTALLWFLCGEKKKERGSEILLQLYFILSFCIIYIYIYRYSHIEKEKWESGEERSHSAKQSCGCICDSKARELISYFSTPKRVLFSPSFSPETNINWKSLEFMRLSQSGQRMNSYISSLSVSFLHLCTLTYIVLLYIELCILMVF